MLNENKTKIKCFIVYTSPGLNNYTKTKFLTTWFYII